MTKKPPLIIAQPFKWPDPATIPPRQFLFGRHYQRKTVSATIGGGGRGKTTLGTLELVSMACGRNLLTGEPTTPLRVWLLNGEEEQNELDRRVVAVSQHYGISETDCGDRLLVQAVQPLRFATLVNNRPTLNRDLLDQFEAEIRVKRIDVVMLDPLISFHSIVENDNGHMDLLIKEGLRWVAARTGTAIELFHHPGKPKPGEAETVVENARGASAIILAVRSARVLNFMAPQEAEKLGISEDDRRLHIRITNGKANMGPLGKAIWFKLAVENLPNGDEVACASLWKRPDPFFGITPTDMYECRRLAQTGAYRLDSRSHDWIGYAVAERLGIGVVHGAENDPRELARLKQILATWFKNKVFATEKRRDRERKERTFVIPGPWQPDGQAEDVDPEELVLQ
jgi:AAA domain